MRRNPCREATASRRGRNDRQQACQSGEADFGPCLGGGAMASFPRESWETEGEI